MFVALLLLEMSKLYSFMKKAALLLISIFYFITASISQETKAQTQQAAMQQLKWLVGRWTGRSELSVEGHTIVTYVQEIITPMLDETIYTVSARGSSIDSTTGKIKAVYNSFGVISYNIKEKQYRWRTWRNPGDSYDEAAFKVGENLFEYISNENGGYMRYKANLNEQGQWVETGEFSKDKQTWGLFIKMTLNKRK
jgi:hypothetical protein